MGLMFIQAVTFADIPVMAAYLLVVAFFFLAINLCVDILYQIIDPRLRIRPGRGKRLWALMERLRLSAPAVLAGLVTLILVSAGLLAPWIAPHDPFDLASLRLTDAFTPPVWSDQGNSAYLARYGRSGPGHAERHPLRPAHFPDGRLQPPCCWRRSLASGWESRPAISAAGSTGRSSRLADIQLSFPPVLIALLIDGVARTALPRDLHASISIHVVILAIGLSFWVQYARTVRGLTLVEREKDYVNAARLIGVHPVRIVFGHILPNVMGPVLVITTINLALAIIVEATLSFLGLGVPPTRSSLGTLIRIGNDFPVFRRMVDRRLSRRHPGQSGAGRESAGGLAARYAEPEAQIAAVLKAGVPPAGHLSGCGVFLLSSGAEPDEFVQEIEPEVIAETERQGRDQHAEDCRYPALTLPPRKELIIFPADRISGTRDRIQTYVEA